MKAVIDNLARATRRFAAARCAAAALPLIFMVIAAGPAAARPRPPLTSVQLESPVTAFPAQRGGGVSLAQATAMATSRFPGRVVRAETVNQGKVHEIRILGDDGRVRTVRIDAQTGAFL
jgi:hypothetical protein